MIGMDAMTLVRDEAVEAPVITRPPRNWIYDDEPEAFTTRPLWTWQEYLEPPRTLTSWLLRRP